MVKTAMREMRTRKLLLDQFLNPAQLDAVERWLPGCTVVADLSWHETDTLVLHLRTPGSDYILKSAGAVNHHFERELVAHSGPTAALVESGFGAALRFADSRARLMILEYLPGRLSEHTARELDPEFHRQAGHALRTLHQGTGRLDAEYESKLLAVSLKRLGQGHRIEPENERRAYEALRAYRPRPVRLVPTHGDWQPRNWLSDHGNLKVIDFGRFDYRAPSTDLVRLANQQWLGRPELEKAFLQGYGGDPRQARSWPIECLHEAIGTVVYAYRLGAEDFEAQGQRMLGRALQLAGC